MNQKLILLPLLAQVLLTIIVSLRLVTARVNEMRRKRIHPQKIATATGASQQLSDSLKISDNFSNQFETPVVFYTLIVLLYITSMANTVFMVLTSLFAVLRYVHSYIHCGSNNVMQRFYIFVTSAILLWLSWALFAFELIKSL
jgi:hypothetical protein